MSINPARVIRERNKVNKLIRSDPERDISNLKHSMANVSHFRATSEKFFAATGLLNRLNGTLIGPLMAHSLPQNPKLTLSFLASFKYLEFHFSSAANIAGHRTSSGKNFHQMMGQDAPFLQAVGWVDKAQDVINYAWGGYIDSKSDLVRGGVGNPFDKSRHNTYATYKTSWYMTMAFADPAAWREKYQFTPYADALGPYFLLAKHWDDPDPENVRNIITAVREMNIGTAIVDDERLPEGTIEYMVDGLLLWLDHDVRSVNMKRKSVGLDMIEGIERYVDYDLPDVEMPFAIDDVFYPMYCDLCKHVDVEPFVPENPVKVMLDIENLTVQQA